MRSILFFTWSITLWAMFPVFPDAHASRTMEDFAGDLAGLEARVYKTPVILPKTHFWHFALVPENPKELLEEILEFSARTPNRSLRARALALSAEMDAPNDSGARERLHEAVRLAHRSGDSITWAYALLANATLLYRKGEYLEAWAYADRAQSIFEQEPDLKGFTRAVSLLGLIHIARRQDRSLSLLSDYFSDLIPIHIGTESTFAGSLKVLANAFNEESISYETMQWFRVLDGFQNYVQGRRSIARKTWHELATAGDAGPLIRGLAWLGAIRTDMDELHSRLQDREVESTEEMIGSALKEARNAFTRSGCKGGVFQSHLLEAEFNYLKGNPHTARDHLKKASDLLPHLENKQAPVCVELVRAEGEIRIKNLGAAEAALDSANQIVRQQCSGGGGDTVALCRVPKDSVARLIAFAKDNPFISGESDTRSFEEKLFSIRQFHRWTKGQNDPLLLLLSTNALIPLLEEAGYREDAFYYRSLRAILYANYRSRVPLRERLLRSALLSYDILTDKTLLERTVRSMSHPQIDTLKDQSWSELNELLSKDETEIMERLGFDEMLKSIIDAQKDDEKEIEFKKKFGIEMKDEDDFTNEKVMGRVRDYLKSLLPYLRQILGGTEKFMKSVSSGRKEEAAGHLRDVRKQMRLLDLKENVQMREHTNQDAQIKSINFSAGEDSERFTSKGDNRDTGGTHVLHIPYEFHSKTALTGKYIFKSYKYLPIELMHRFALQDYDWGLITGEFLEDESAVALAVDEISAFYDLFGALQKPPAGIEIPEMFRKGDLFELSEERNTEEAADARGKMLDRSLEAHFNEYYNRLVRSVMEKPYKAFDQNVRESLDGKGIKDLEGFSFEKKFLRNQEDTLFLFKNYNAGPERIRIQKNDVKVEQEGDRWDISIDHVFETNMVLKSDSPFLVIPEPVFERDLTKEIREIRTAMAPAPMSADSNFEKILMDYLGKGYVKSLFGQELFTSVRSLEEIISDYHTILVAGQIALSARSRDDMVPLNENITFSSLSARIQGNKELAAMLSELAKAILDLRRSESERDREAKPGEQIAELIHRFQGKVFSLSLQEQKGGAGTHKGFIPVSAFLEKAMPLLSLSCYPEMVLTLLGEKELAEEYGRLLLSRQQAGKRTPSTPLGERHMSGKDWERENFSVILHHMLEGQYGEAIESMESSRKQGLWMDPVSAFQIEYLEAICYGRGGDRGSQEARLRSAVEKLEKVRRRLRTRALTAILGPVRRLLYEQYSSFLHAWGKHREMLHLFSRYKDPSLIPASILTPDRGESLYNGSISKVVLLYDTLARRTDWLQIHRRKGVGDILAGSLDHIFESVFDGDSIFGKNVIKNRILFEGLNSMSNTLMNELPIPHGEEPETPELSIPKGSILITYFVGSQGTYGVICDHGGNTDSFYSAVSMPRLSEAVSDVRRSIRERREKDDQLVMLHGQLLPDALASVSAERIIIWPDGPLWFLPFQALKKNSEAPYLIQTHAVSYLTGSNALTSFKPPSSSLRGADLLVIADPDGSLPRAKEEARHITSLPGWGTTETLVGKEADMIQLASQLEKADLIHFATHARFESLYPHFSYLQLARGDRLYCIDIGNLPFSGKHVFLSACETQVGEQLPGEDIYGVASSLVASGAASVVSTLWRVQSESTALFAERYYGQVLAGQTPEEALARVARSFISQEEWLEDHGDIKTLQAPYHWAAFNHLTPVAQ